MGLMDTWEGRPREAYDCNSAYASSTKTMLCVPYLRKWKMEFVVRV